jgi:hypothetical protein
MARKLVAPAKIGTISTVAPNAPNVIPDTIGAVFWEVVERVAART